MKELRRPKKPGYINKKTCVSISKEVAKLAFDFYSSSGQRKRELFVDALFYGYLAGRYRSVERQVPSGYNKTRIDLRVKGTNPVNIELAVRPSKGKGSELHPSQNITELKKLVSNRSPHARARYLILIDYGSTAFKKHNLEKLYKNRGLGRGNWKQDVTVVYLHCKKAMIDGKKQVRIDNFIFKYKPKVGD